MDLQFIATQEHALNQYVTGYMCKKEKANTEEMFEICNQEKSLQSRLKSHALASLKKRECGIFEASDILFVILVHKQNF